MPYQPRHLTADQRGQIAAQALQQAEAQLLAARIRRIQATWDEEVALAALRQIEIECGFAEPVPAEATDWRDMPRLPTGPVKEALLCGLQRADDWRGDNDPGAIWLAESVRRAELERLRAEAQEGQGDPDPC